MQQGISYSVRFIAISLLAFAGSIGGLIYFGQRNIIYISRAYSSYGYHDYYEQMKTTFNRKHYYRQIIDISSNILDSKPHSTSSSNNNNNSNEKKILYKHKGYLIPAERVAESEVPRLWILTGGNAQLGLDWLPFVSDLLYRRNVKHESFFLFDYPGYGDNYPLTPDATKENRQELTLKLMKENVEAVVKLLKYPPKLKIGFISHSLGCAAALHFSERVNNDKISINNGNTKVVVDRLVLGSPFTSIPSMASKIFGNEAISDTVFEKFVFDKWDNRIALKDYLEGSMKNNKGNIFIQIFHGIEDEIVPVEMGRSLYSIGDRIRKSHPVQQSGFSHHENKINIRYHEVHGDHNSLIMMKTDEIINAIIENDNQEKALQSKSRI